MNKSTYYSTRLRYDMRNLSIILRGPSDRVESMQKSNGSS